MHVARAITAASAVYTPQPPLRVMYVLAAFPVLSETFVSNEIRAMRAAGHHVVPLALAPFDGDCQPEDEQLKGETVALRRQPAALALLASVASPAGLRAALRFARAQTALPARSLLLAGARAAWAARRHGCTHLHAHFALAATATAIVAARLAGLTVSFMAHGYDVYASPADLSAKLRHADLAIATCEQMRRDFLAMAPQARVRVVHCGSDPHRFRPQPGGARNGRLLAVGRMVEQKGYDVLLAALAALPPDERPTIDAVGGGELADALEWQALTLGVSASINFLGPRPAAWIAAEGPAYLGFVAPYCVTEAGDRDTAPLVLREAMMMGLPIVASDLMGLAETVNTSCGQLVPPRDVASLAAGLRWLAEMPEEDRLRLGIAGRHRAVTRFSLTNQAAQLTEAIRAVQAFGPHT